MSRSVFMHRRGGRLLLAADSFNRADGAIGSTDGGGMVDPKAWTTLDGTMSVSSNTAVGATIGSPSITVVANVVSLNLGTPDVDISLTIGGTLNGTNSELLIARIASINSFLYSTGGALWWWHSGATTLATAGIVPVVGDVVRLVANSNKLSTYVNGALSASVTNTTNINTTSHGFGTTSSAVTVDNWSAYSAP